MSKHIHIKHRIRLTLSILLLVAVVAFIAYKMIKRYDMVNSSVFNNFEQELEVKSEQFKNNADFAAYINEWAGRQGLIAINDDFGNIIIQSSGTEKGSTNVVCVDYDCKTVKDRYSPIASAQYIAASQNLPEIKGGPINVIFLNDENGSNKGVKNISGDYIPPNSNVLYISSDEKSYSSNRSYSGAVSKIRIGTSKVPRHCDTLIKVKIDGIDSTTAPGDNDIHQPNIINQLQMILTKLRSKPTDFQIANIKFADNGSLYTTSMQLDLLINRYDLEMYKEWFEKKAHNFEKTNRGHFPQASYKYNVLDNPSQLPQEAYDDESMKKLANILYTVRNGSYKFDDDQVETAKKLNIKDYGINIITHLYANDGEISSTIVTNAYNDRYLEQIINENKTAASFFGATDEVIERYPIFRNRSHKLNKMLAKAYTKVNLVTTRDVTIYEDHDEYFTPCSFIATKSPGLDVIHIAESPEEGINISNVILNYNKWPGNKIF